MENKAQIPPLDVLDYLLRDSISVLEFCPFIHTLPKRKKGQILLW